MTQSPFCGAGTFAAEPPLVPALAAAKKTKIAERTQQVIENKGNPPK
jgi:hypothetical protein